MGSAEPGRRDRRRLAVGLAWLVSAAAVGSLHTELEESDPAADSVVAAPVRAVTLTFTTDVRLSLSSVAVRADGAASDAPGELAYQDDGRRDALSFRPDEPLGAGAHAVRWTTAGPDGHAISGEFAFRAVGPTSEATSSSSGGRAEGSVSGSDEGEGRAPATTSREAAGFSRVGEAAAQALLYLGTLGLLGAVAFRLRILAPLSARPASVALAEDAARRTRAIAAAAAAALLLSAPARLWWRTRTFFPDPSPADLWTIATAGPWAVGWWLQAALGVAAALALARAKSDASAGPGGAWTTVAGVALLLPCVAVLSGHAWSDEARAAAVATTYLHVVAAGAWLGALGCLAFAALPAWRKRTRDAERTDSGDLAATVESFSRLARAAVAVLLLSGAVRTGLHVDALADLWTTPWGRALAVKVGVVAGVAGLGLYNWRVARPRLAARPDPGALRASVLAETLLGVAAVIATSFLVGQPLR